MKKHTEILFITSLLFRSDIISNKDFEFLSFIQLFQADIVRKQTRRLLLCTCQVVTNNDLRTCDVLIVLYPYNTLHCHKFYGSNKQHCIHIGLPVLYY